MKHQTRCVWLAGIMLLGFSAAVLGQEELVVVLNDGRRQSLRADWAVWGNPTIR
jgi:hypothetical protein